MKETSEITSKKLQLNEQRTTVSDLGARMLADGLTKGTGGNISVRAGDAVAISPSGMPYDEITPADVPLIDYEGAVVEGDRTPSSEVRMHTGVLREREDVGAVVHTHSPYASTFASLAEPIPASHYLIAFAGDKVPVAGYATYGTADLAELAVKTLGKEYDACLLRNHGVLATGETAEAAYETALMVEYCAQIHYQATDIGDPEILPAEEVDRLREVFAGYGQSAQDHSDAVGKAPGDLLETERNTVAELGRRMLEDDLTRGTGGNVSARNDDRVAINPSGVAYEDVEPSNVPIVDIDGEQIAGELAASSETPMHTRVYREREDVGAVVHTHSPYASTFASLAEPIPASHYLIAFAGDMVPVADYDVPGTEALGALAADALGDEYNACLLQNHGVLTVGENLGAAYETALMVEYCARIHYQATDIGEPELLPDEEVDTLFERFAGYGQDH